MGCKTTLGNLCSFRAGTAFPTLYQGEHQGDLPFIKVRDMNAAANGRFINVADNWITRETASELKAKAQPAGAIVFAKIGEALKANRMRQLIMPTIVDNNMMAAIPADSTDSYYLYYLLTSLGLANWADGTALPYFKQKTLASIEVDNPGSIEQQRRTVSTLKSLDDKIELNNRLNGYLGEQCEAIASHEKGHIVELASLCDLVKDKADYSEANFDTYVSTESLLPGKMGRQAPSSLPQAGTITVYKVGDILVSNIRPYFKKIWYADQAGTCSGDVLVFRAKQPEQSGYLYSRMRSDAFFDYAMKGAKGTKMPRGDKKQMLTYKVGGNPNGATIDFIESALNQASSISKENRKLATLRDALLPKLISGEIDVSKVDLTRLNSHLA